MDRRVGVSELRRRPMALIREVQGGATALTITFRGSPVAVLHGWPAPGEVTPRLQDVEEDEPEAFRGGEGWPRASVEPEVSIGEAALDSASWGQWETLSETERRDLMRAMQQRPHE